MVGWPEGADIDWEILDRIDRPRSSVFRIRAIDPPGPAVDAYYKVYLPTGDDIDRERRERDARETIYRALELDQRLAELIRALPITFSQTLAADPGSLTHVTLGVDGTPFGKAWQHRLTPSRREAVLRSLGLVGQAAKLIEQCSPESIEIDEREIERMKLKRQGRMSRALAEPRLSTLDRRFRDLDETIQSDPRAFVYAHCDLSSSNVLLHEGGIGLIDFSWLRRLRGFDIARFAFRIEYETLFSRSWAEAMVEALLRGYGDPDLKLSPNWLALRLPWLLKVVRYGSQSRFSRDSRRARWAMDEIEAAL